MNIGTFRKSPDKVLNILNALLFCAVIFTVAAGIVDRAAPADTSVYGEEPIILIDPGHGGADGGAVGLDGTLEKDLNLAISLPLRDLLQVMGYRVETTRTTDISTHTEGSTLREQKISDLQNRLRLAQQAAITVSVHQNQFTSSKYYGAQLFYSVNHEDSRLLAESIRASVVGLLQPENTRELKPGNRDILLLHRSTRPTVIVECGFISNAAELEKLKTREYQLDMAFAIAVGVLQYAP